MFKLALAALAATAANGQLLATAPLGYNYPAAVAAPLQYAQVAAPAALNYAQVAPLNYAPAAVQYAAAPAVAYAPQPTQYAVSVPRVVEEAPIVAQTVEKVEQHGYSIRY